MNNEGTHDEEAASHTEEFTWGHNVEHRMNNEDTHVTEVVSQTEEFAW
jgi:hypothetical protein